MLVDGLLKKAEFSPSFGSNPERAFNGAPNRPGMR